MEGLLAGLEAVVDDIDDAGRATVVDDDVLLLRDEVLSMEGEMNT